MRILLSAATGTSAGALPEKIENILRTVRNMELIDYIDIICVSILLYYLFKFIRDRRAGKLAIGVLLLFVIQLVSSIADMYLLNYIMQNIFQIGFITLVVLFQPEIRSVLEKFGAQPLKGIKSIAADQKNSTQNTLKTIEEVVSAVVDFSEDRTGALIVFERTTKLGDMILTGTVIDAQPVAFLIKNIFFNKAPLHDGALIIRDNRLHAGGCLLPLSNNPDIIKDLGTRHRAGIGMSENSDAVVIIVSEETGVISTAVEGELTRGYDAESLSAFLRHQLTAESADKHKFDLLGKVRKKNS